MLHRLVVLELLGGSEHHELFLQALSVQAGMMPGVVVGLELAVVAEVHVTVGVLAAAQVAGLVR
jgi:hypothetical protein